jgi:two-component system, NtrC family, nitrogen regulation sensor histidine kinase GlnL
MPEREYHSFSGLDLLASAVILVDDSCNIRYLNPAAENLVATSTNTLSRQQLGLYRPEH